MRWHRPLLLAGFLSVPLVWAGESALVSSHIVDNDPHGSYRWETMPEAMKSNVLEQVAIRRVGERMAVVRNSVIDCYRLNEIHFPESQDVKDRLFRLGIGGWTVSCGIYPRFERMESGWEGVFMYSKIKCERKWPTSLYLPKEVHLLCIIDRSYCPLRELMTRMIWGNDLEFCEDAWKLPEDIFLDKYGLRSIFSNSVYRVRERCVMVVDYPSSEDKDIFIYKEIEGKLDPHFARERQRVENERLKALYSSRNHGILSLSQEEASELVALVGRQWYYGDDSKYRELRREYPWFQPVDVTHPKTQLGKDLKATIEAKERMKQK